MSCLTLTYSSFKFKELLLKFNRDHTSKVNIVPGQISISHNAAYPSNEITVHGVSFKNEQCGGVGDCFFKYILRWFADCDILSEHI